MLAIPLGGRLKKASQTNGPTRTGPPPADAREAPARQPETAAGTKSCPDGAGLDSNRLRRADTGTRARVLQSLQNGTGNASVQKLVAPEAVAARPVPGQADVVQRDVPLRSMLQLDVRTYTKAWAGQITADLAKEMAHASWRRLGRS